MRNPDPDQTYWMFSGSDEGKATSFVVLHAGFDETTTSPLDLGGTDAKAAPGRPPPRRRLEGLRPPASSVGSAPAPAPAAPAESVAQPTAPPPEPATGGASTRSAKPTPAPGTRPKEAADPASDDGCYGERREGCPLPEDPYGGIARD